MIITLINLKTVIVLKIECNEKHFLIMQGLRAAIGLLDVSIAPHGFVMTMVYPVHIRMWEFKLEALLGWFVEAWARCLIRRKTEQYPEGSRIGRLTRNANFEYRTAVCGFLSAAT